MRKILVTGANGLLGQKLVYRLRWMNNVECIALGRGENRLNDKRGFEYRNVDISDHNSVKEVIKKERPTHIIHGAAMTNVDACETDQASCKAANVDAVENIAAICDELSIHLIHVSTDFIFDGKEGPYNETAEANPVSYYGWSKLEAEKIVMGMKAPWAIVRTVLVYGITDNLSRSNIVLWVKNSLEQGKTINVVDDQFRSPTLAEDLAEGCILVALKDATGVYNVSGDEQMSIYEIAHKVAEHYNLDKALIKPTDSASLNQPAKRPPITGFILDKAKSDLGYQPTSFNDSLKLMDRQMEEQSHQG